MFRKSAYDVFKEEMEAGFIVTLCKDFDEAIGGGIRIGAITELVGQPGAGKTQFWYFGQFKAKKSLSNILIILFSFIQIAWQTRSLQLCVNVQIPKNLRGLGGAAVFIDTNRGFSLDRIKG